MSSYKPTEHDGKKLDGSDDKRVSSEHGLGADRERASELGKQGGKASGSENEVVDEDFDPNGQDPAAGLEPAIEDAGDDSTTGTSGGGDYKPSEHDGLRKDGKPDGRMKGN